jgi:CHAT domain-containing protein
MDKYELQQYTSTREVALRNSRDQITKPSTIMLFGNARFTMDSLQLAKQIASQKGNLTTSIYTPQKRSSNDNSWDSLPGTAQEINKIKELFDQHKITAKIFIQTTASEENLKALDNHSPQVLHIATHGFFLSDPDEKRVENEQDRITHIRWQKIRYSEAALYYRAAIMHGAVKRLYRAWRTGLPLLMKSPN